MLLVQFYLGTTRLQLEHKGDTAHHFTAFANIIPAFGFLGIPVITWLLDKKGYGATLATINFLTVLASLFEAMPSLRFQVVIYSAFLTYDWPLSDPLGSVKLATQDIHRTRMPEARQGFEPPAKARSLPRAAKVGIAAIEVFVHHV